jgi:hypothetical protein
LRLDAKSQLWAASLLTQLPLPNRLEEEFDWLSGWSNQKLPTSSFC